MRRVTHMLEQIIFFFFFFTTWVPLPYQIKILCSHINAILAVFKGQHNGYWILQFVFNIFKILQKTHRFSDSSCSSQESE